MPGEMKPGWEQAKKDMEEENAAWEKASDEIKGTLIGQDPKKDE